MAGAGQLHLPGRARVRAQSGDPETGDLGAGGRQRARRAARSRGAGAAPRQRAGGDDARGAALLLRAVAAHHHQGQRREPRAPARAHGLHRHQDLPRRRHAEGRDPLRRPVHVAGLRQLAEPDPVAAPQGRRPCSAASGYPPASHAGKALLNILDTFPRDELFQIGARAAAGMERGHPRSGDAAARARVRPHRPLRPVRLRCSSTCRATATHPACASRSARCWPRPTRAASSAFYPYFPEGPLVRVQFIVGRYAGPTPQVDVGRARARDRRDRAHLGGPAGRCHCRARATTRRSAAGQVRHGVLRRLRRDLPGRAGAGGHQAHRAARAATSPSPSISIASRARRRAASTPPSIASARRSRSPSACRCWRTWASRPSTSAPITSRRASPTACATSRCTTWCWRPPTAPPSSSSVTTSGWRMLPRRAARRGRQRRLQPPDRLGRRRLARGGRRCGPMPPICASSARRSACATSPTRCTAMPAWRATCSSCSICASIRSAGSASAERQAAEAPIRAAHRGRAGRRAEPR